MHESRRIAVIGAGPKAAALAAKSHVLNLLGLTRTELHIYEREEIAANWTGGSGWTSGSERLGTRAQKDVGFPYRSDHRFGGDGKRIDTHMQAFSWQSHLIDSGTYQQWVDAGMPAPTHRQFADYLTWVLTKAVDGVRVHRAEVTGLAHRPDGWTLRHRAGATERESSFDALVLTGHGRPAALPHHPEIADRLLTSASRREALLGFRPLLRGARICVVGAGESSASAALYLLAHLGEDASVTIVSPYLPRSRAESPLEDGVYSDPGTASWHELSEEARQDFISRTDRGVISSRALAQLADAHTVSFVLGRVRYVDAAPSGRARVTIDQPGGESRCAYDLVVNCTGGSPLRQLASLLDATSTGHVEAALGVGLSDEQAVTRGMDESLALRGLHPRLHIPGLAGLAQGPGFANLSSLGLLSDRILSAHLTPVAPTSRPPARSATPTQVPG